MAHTTAEYCGFRYATLVSIMVAGRIVHLEMHTQPCSARSATLEGIKDPHRIGIIRMLRNQKLPIPTPSDTASLSIRQYLGLRYLTVNA